MTRRLALRHAEALRRRDQRRAQSYVDLQGRHQLDLVFSTYDGDVHALTPAGHELPGFPVHSDLIRSFDPAAPEGSSARAYRTSRSLPQHS